MKNNSFKYSGLVKFMNKKFVLTAVLAAVLSGPYIFQVSSKDFNLSEFASEAEVTQEGYESMMASALAQIGKADPTKAGLKVLPADSEITDPTAKQLAALARQMGETLEKNKIATAIQEAKDKAANAAKAKADLAKKEKEDAETAEKKAKEEAAERKKNDCTDKDKSSAEKIECRNDAKEAERVKKQEENEEKFIAKYEMANERCISRARTKEASEELELKCQSQGFAAALNQFKRKKDGELSMGFVNEQFKDIIGNDLFKMLFSENADEVEKANVIMSNLFGGKIPTQFNGLKRLVMDEVRRKANSESDKVVASFKKANAYPKNSNEYMAQYAAATAEQDQFGDRLFSHGGAMYNSLYRAGDLDGLSYYKTSYLGNNARIQKALLAASIGTTTGGEAGAAARNAATRDGRAATTEARVGADGKMTRSGGVSYILDGREQNVSFGSPSATRVGKIRPGVRVAQ
jgi:hypothetical protein